MLEVDASGGGGGTGAVLMQGLHPIAYISRILNTQQQLLSTYEKELLAIFLQYKNGDIICGTDISLSKQITTV